MEREKRQGAKWGAGGSGRGGEGKWRESRGARGRGEPWGAMYAATEAALTRGGERTEQGTDDAPWTCSPGTDVLFANQGHPNKSNSESEE